MICGFLKFMTRKKCLNLFYIHNVFLTAETDFAFLMYFSSPFLTC